MTRCKGVAVRVHGFMVDARACLLTGEPLLFAVLAHASASGVARGALVANHACCPIRASPVFPTLEVVACGALRPTQECVYHKAVIDKKSPSVLARLAKQVRPGRNCNTTRLLSITECTIRVVTIAGLALTCSSVTVPLLSMAFLIRANASFLSTLVLVPARRASCTTRWTAPSTPPRWLTTSTKAGSSTSA